MSTPRLLPELLDHVVDSLRNEPDDLKSCCLVSKSWIPRTRTHLFAQVTFYEKRLQSWKVSFPDPSTSPACYTKTLFIRLPLSVTSADAKEGGWIPTFSRVTFFGVDDPLWHGDKRAASLALFHGFSPTLKSLHVTCGVFQPSRILCLVHSFPLLENLAFASRAIDTLASNFDGQLITTQSPTPSRFTGSLKLSLEGGMDPFAHHLLSSPGSIHFRRLDLQWCRGEDVSSTSVLAEECCSTLESLRINVRWPIYGSSTGFLDLSKATKLKDVEFVGLWDIQWIIMTLRSITHSHRNFQCISLGIYLPNNQTPGPPDPASVRHMIGETICSVWSELDHLLDQLWESHSTRPEVQWSMPSIETVSRCYMEALLPKATARGIAVLTRKVVDLRN